MVNKKIAFAFSGSFASSRSVSFAALPSVQGQLIKMLIGGGIVIIVGNLSAAWGLDEELALPRETIRTAVVNGY
ncbi:MAG: hypothetical protein F6K63_31470 [Moorea sp. SIO1G6]|uniref:hypothetical protein n=1 Tax=Moorena sp. SIO1G6 TaxID=2607840 RepID=UPI0013C0D4F9|nr:hypothetical protein [Moorena sp. SIO1G6]NET68673.1 hypothetical protein [Moorena sp. SIO1G6]